MKFKDCLIAWNPKSDQVRVGSLRENWECAWDRGYLMTTGGCCSYAQKLSHEQAKTMSFIEAIHLIIRDRVDPDAVHREFCKIDEYCDGLAPDVVGSNYLSEH